MGGGSNKAQDASTAIAQQQAKTGDEFIQLAKDQLAKSTALEQPLVDFYTAISKGSQGERNIAASPLTGNIARNTQAAEQNIMNTVPEGAGRDAALAMARVQQGQQTADTLNQTYTSALSGLAQLGSGNASIGLSEAGAGLSGYGGAQSAYGTQEQAQAQQKSSMMGAIGSIVGGAAGTIKWCWIAEAIYGVDDFRTHEVRAWLIGPFRERLHGRVLMNIYGAIGQQVAALVKSSNLLRAALKPLFDIALRKALNGRKSTS